MSIDVSQVREFLKKYKNLKWIVAFSGGADSRVLLELLSQNKDLAKSIKAIYVHHHLQTIADSWAETNAIEANKLDVDYVVEHVCVKEKGSVEANARDARYEAFSKHMDKDTILFTAHHADDLVESILLAIARGSGLDGLCAMPTERTFAEGKLVRPLLQYSRNDIEEYTKEHDLFFVTDPTNKDICYDRNYLRNEVIPLIKKRFPQILNNTYKCSENLKQAKLIVDNQYELWLKEVMANLYANPCLSLSKLQSFSENEQMSIVHYFAKKYFNINLSRKQSFTIIGFKHIEDGSKQKLDTDNIVWSLYKDYIYVAPKEIQTNSDKLTLKIEQSCTEYTVDGYLYKLSPIMENTSLVNASRNIVKTNIVNQTISSNYLLPIETEELSIILKSATSTRLHPKRRVHSQTLKNLWKEYNVPLYWRHLSPIVAIQNEIIALHGVFENRNSLDAKIIDNNEIENFVFDKTKYKIVRLEIQKAKIE